VFGAIYKVISKSKQQNVWQLAEDNANMILICSKNLKKSLIIYIACSLIEYSAAF